MRDMRLPDWPRSAREFREDTEAELSRARIGNAGYAVKWYEAEVG